MHINYHNLLILTYIIKYYDLREGYKYNKC